MTASEIGVGVRELLAEARRLGLVWDLRPATITENRLRLAGVLDGDATSVITDLTSLVGRPEIGARVMIMSVPPAGNYVVGYLTSNEPAVGQSLLRFVDSDISITNSAVITDNIFATFEMLPNRMVFRLLGWLWWTSTSGTPDFRVGITGIAGIAGESSLIAQGTGASTAEGTVNTGVGSPLTTNHTRGTFNGALSGLLAGWVDTTVANAVADLEIGVAQGNSGVTAVVLKKGSWVELTRMS